MICNNLTFKGPSKSCFMHQSTESTDSDHFLTDYFTSKLNYTKDHIQTIGSLQGIWGIDHTEAKQLLEEEFADIAANRRRDSERKTIDGKTFLRYSFIIRLNSGVIENHPLPKAVPIKLIFYRADAEKALLSLSLNPQKTESTVTYDFDRSIRLINPLLELFNTQSEELDKKYSQHRLPDLDLPFLDKQIRLIRRIRITQTENVSSFFTQMNHKT